MNLSIFTVSDIVLVLLLGLALYFDLTRKRIPNFLTFPALALGLLLAAALSGLDGFLNSLYGLLLGAAVFLIPFALGWLGAGDVKLLAAVGALQGWQFVLAAALLTALFGGVMALIYLLITGRLLFSLKKILGLIAAPLFSRLYYAWPLRLFNRAAVFFSPAEEPGGEPLRMPYGAAIAAGALGLLVWTAAGGGVFPGGLFGF